MMDVISVTGRRKKMNISRNVLQITHFYVASCVNELKINLSSS